MDTFKLHMEGTHYYSMHRSVSPQLTMELWPDRVGME
jgi:hypothetical protein